MPLPGANEGGAAGPVEPHSGERDAVRRHQLLQPAIGTRPAQEPTKRTNEPQEKQNKAEPREGKEPPEVRPQPQPDPVARIYTLADFIWLLLKGVLVVLTATILWIVGALWYTRNRPFEDGQNSGYGSMSNRYSEDEEELQRQRRVPGWNNPSPSRGHEVREPAVQRPWVASSQEATPGNRPRYPYDTMPAQVVHPQPAMSPPEAMPAPVLVPTSVPALARRTPAARIGSYVIPNKRLVCEDHVETLVLGDTLVVAVADGVGGASRAYFAARWATGAAIAEIMARLRTNADVDRDTLQRIISEVVPTRMQERLEVSDSEGSPQEYKATLSLGVLRNGFFHYAMTGDGIMLRFDPATREWIPDLEKVERGFNTPEAVYPGHGVTVRARSISYPAPDGAVFVVGTDGFEKALRLLGRQRTYVIDQAGQAASARRSADTFIDVFVNGAHAELLDANDDVSFAVVVACTPEEGRGPGAS